MHHHRLPRFLSGQLLRSMAGAMKSYFFQLNMASPQHGNTKYKTAKTRVFFASSSGDERWHEQCLVVSRGMASLQTPKTRHFCTEMLCICRQNCFLPRQKKGTKCRKYRCFCMDVIIVPTCMLWPFARSGHTNVIIVRTWMLW